jgi:uncharacterized protein
MSQSSSTPFLKAAWRHLVMLHYKIDPGVLQGLVPAGTHLDLWNDHAFVSVVGFRFLHTRILSLPVPFHQDFDEINLRFYVKRQVHGETRHGVVFIREAVALPTIAFAAKATYNEPYVVLPTRHHVDMDDAETGKAGFARYQWKEDDWYTLEAETQGLPSTLEPGTLDEFLSQRHWGYTRQRDGGTIEYEVVHPRWRYWSPGIYRLECDIARMYGPQFVPALTGKPALATLVEGSAVTLFMGRRLSD